MMHIEKMCLLPAPAGDVSGNWLADLDAAGL